MIIATACIPIWSIDGQGAKTQGMAREGAAKKRSGRVGRKERVAKNENGSRLVKKCTALPKVLTGVLK